MKKKLFISTILIGLGMMNVQAQTVTHDKEKATQKIKLTGGTILEGNLTNFIHSGIDKGSSNMGMGTSIGGFLNGIANAVVVEVPLASFCNLLA